LNIHNKRATFIEIITPIVKGAPKLMWQLKINLDTKGLSALGTYLQSSYECALCHH